MRQVRGRGSTYVPVDSLQKLFDKQINFSDLQRKYIHHISLKKGKMKHGDLADSAVTVELVQMLEKEVWKRVKFSDLSYKRKNSLFIHFCS